MTEQEWLACKDFHAMLRYLHYLRCAKQGREFDPKACLLACAACRHIWNLMEDQRSRDGVEAAEEHAIGNLNEQSFALAAESAVVAWQEAEQQWRAVFGNEQRKLLARGRAWAASAAVNATGRQALPPGGRSHGNRGTVGSALEAAQSAAVCMANATDQPGQRALSEEVRAQSGFLHELFGNPFCPVTADPSWLAWNDGTIPRIAQAIYDDRRFADMPILADALEEAGCTNGKILAHCRSGGPHFRGCWVVDLLLGKE